MSPIKGMHCQGDSIQFQVSEETTTPFRDSLLRQHLCRWGWETAPSPTCWRAMRQHSCEYMHPEVGLHNCLYEVVYWRGEVLMRVLTDEPHMSQLSTDKCTYWWSSTHFYHNSMPVARHPPGKSRLWSLNCLGESTSDISTVLILQFWHTCGCWVWWSTGLSSVIS